MNTKLIEVLLVEDSAEDVDLIKEAFNHSSFQVRLTVADDGEKAMHYLYKQKRPLDKMERTDLIILDLNLPKKNGLDILMEIKKDENLRSIPVVIFTTSRSPEDIVKAYSNHTNCYICKPPNFESFIYAIKKIEDFWFKTVQLPFVFKGGNHEQ